MVDGVTGLTFTVVLHHVEGGQSWGLGPVIIPNQRMVDKIVLVTRKNQSFAMIITAPVMGLFNILLILHVFVNLIKENWRKIWNINLDSMYNFVINNQHNYKSMYFW